MLIHQKGMVLEDISFYKQSLPETESDILILENDENNISLTGNSGKKKKIKFGLSMAYFITLTIMITILLLS